MYLLGLINARIPQPNNIFFIYFAAQTIENNLVSVYDQMTLFLTEHSSIDKNTGNKFFNGAMEFLKHIYLTKIKLTKNQTISYNLTDTFSKLIQAPYT